MVLSGLQAAIPDPVLAAGRENAAVLSSLGYEVYAKGFEALHTIGSVLLGVGSVALAGHFLVWRRDALALSLATTSYFKVAGMLCAGTFMVWWAALSGEFYSAADKDFSGSLRPWFGSIIYGIAIWLAPLLLMLGLAVVVAKARSKDGS